MRTQQKGRIAFAVCGSFCTLEAALAAAQQLTEQGWELLPIMSFAAKQDLSLIHISTRQTSAPPSAAIPARVPLASCLHGRKNKKVAVAHATATFSYWERRFKISSRMASATSALLISGSSRVPSGVMRVTTLVLSLIHILDLFYIVQQVLVVIGVHEHIRQPPNK